jgi:hypothetical protein
VTEAEVQVVSDDREVAAARDGGRPGYRLPAGPAMLGTSPDPAQAARLVLEAVIPGFADAAGVYVLEQLLRGGDPARRAAGTQLIVRRLGTGFAQAGQLAPQAAFPAGEVIALAADSPYARCMDHGTPVIFGQLDSTTLERINPGARQILARYASFLTAPLTAGGTAIGFLSLARVAGAPAFGDDDAATTVRLTAGAGTGIASSLTLLQQRSIADALPPRLPASSHHALPGLEISGRCRPAPGYAIGGDWYDIIPLPADRTGLIVGDVMGHGPQAAAVRAQLSAVAYALTDLDLRPAEVLHQLNRTALSLPYSTFATCACAVIDPAGHACTIATAGHLPPVLARPGGTTHVPDLPGGQSLGICPASYSHARINLPPGTTLALYTDGLAETRTRPFDQGILALRSVLAREHEHLDATCDELITALGELSEDDITVVLAQIPTQ